METLESCANHELCRNCDPEFYKGKSGTMNVLISPEQDKMICFFKLTSFSIFLFLTRVISTKVERSLFKFVGNGFLDFALLHSE